MEEPSGSQPDTDATVKPPTPAGSEDEQMEKTSIPSSDDETELEDELEPTPKRNKKAANKKTAQDRLNEEREKRLLTLNTMESYIQNIFAILKRDLSIPCAGLSKDASEETSSEASTSTGAASKVVARPKGASTPPEPMPEASNARVSNMETENEATANGSQPDESPASNSGDASVRAPAQVSSAAVASTSQATSPTQI